MLTPQFCRDNSRYRTPYAPWGGFTNGYEGDLRKHLMKKPETMSFGHNRRSSFNIGGGLQGLTRPPSHQYSNSASSSTSPNNGAASPTSSHASAMSPPPFPGRGTGHQRTSSVSTTPSHPAMRTQAGSSSQMTNNVNQIRQGTSGPSNGGSSGLASQQGFPWTGPQSRRTSIPPISPAGIPSQQPTFLNTSPPQTIQQSLPPSPMDIDPDTHESAAQQLKQQLRRISVSKESSPFGMSRSRSHTPSSSRSHMRRLRTPSQPDIHQDERSSESIVMNSSELAANGVAVREFPETPVDNQGILEKLMSDLRRASTHSQPFDGGIEG